jgi:hypothetical protein
MIPADSAGFESAGFDSAGFDSAGFDDEPPASPGSILAAKLLIGRMPAGAWPAPCRRAAAQ